MKRLTYFAALVVCFLAVFESAESNETFTKDSLNVDKTVENMTVLQKWENMEKIAKDAAKLGVKTLLPFFMGNAAKLNLSMECMRNSMHLLSGLKNIKPWAVRFLDSSAKGIDGLMGGSIGSFGSYDECLDTEVKSKRLQDKGKVLFRGQYCIIDIKPPLPPRSKDVVFQSVIDELKIFSERDTAIAEMAKLAQYSYTLPMKLGVCTPSGCSKEDLTKIVKLVADYIYFNASVTKCEIKEEEQFTPVHIGVMTCYSFAGLLMLVGTVIDLYAYYRKVSFKNKLIPVLTAFSFVKNFKKFVNTDTRSDTLSCLNGIRFLTMSWIMAGHTYLLQNHSMVHGLMSFLSVTGEFAFQAVINGSVAVDTFFFVGGLLICFVTVKHVCHQGGKLNIWMYVLHRLWRILPVYAFVIMFMFIVNLMGSGPMLHEFTYRHIKACYDNWWANLLFINNFYDPRHMCIAHSWYLATDLQLYIASLLILIPLTRRPRIGISFAVLTIFASNLYIGIETYVKDLPPTFLGDKVDFDILEDYMVRFYFKPFMHASPYCIGLLAGYLLATKPDMKIPPIIRVVGWCLAFILTFTVLYGVVDWNKGVKPTVLSSVLYASLHRTGWTLGIAWMIICCATGHGGVINYILSWKAFIPLGRLTYLAYLIHPISQVAVVGNLRTPIQSNHYILVWLYFGHLCATYGAAFAGSMLIESPFMALEKVLFKRGDKKEKNNPFVIENNILSGNLKSDKNHDIAVIVPVTEEESLRIDDKSVVYKL